MKLTPEQKNRIVDAMGEIRRRCTGDSDETIGLRGSELTPILQAFGRLPDDPVKMAMLNSGLPIFWARESTFLDAQRSRAIIKNAESLAETTFVILNMVRAKNSRVS